MERRVFFPRLLMMIDAGVVAAAFVLSYYARKLVPAISRLRLGPLEHYLWILLPAIPIWWLLLFLDGAYRPKAESTGAIIRRGLKVGTLVLLILTFILFVINFKTFHRTLLVLFVCVATVMLVATRIGLSSWLTLRRRKGKSTRRALIVTAGEPNSCLQASMLVERMRSNAAEGVVPVGYLALNSFAAGLDVAGLPFKGGVNELPDLLHQEVVDEVYFVLPPSMVDRITDYLKVCEEIGVEGKVLAQLYRPALARPYLEESFELPFFSFSPTSLYVGQRYAKGVMDFVGAFALFVLLAVPIAIIALLIWLSSGGTILFRQERGGLHGRRFVMYKFRTMVPDAEEMQSELAKQNNMPGPVFKLANDPRVTRLGRWLRRASLDELPQLINVLKGDMSLVGPRPLPLAEAAQIKGPLRRRFSMKPGMTGLWQCSGRSNVDFDEWMRLDLEYVDNWSLRLDHQILMKTMLAVLSGRGAR